MTKIYTPEKVIKYAETRFSGRNVDVDKVKFIDLYQAFLPSEVRKKLNEKCHPFALVEQKNPREPIYIQDEAIVISEFSGFSRSRRYKQMIQAYLDVTGKPIEFRVVYPEGEKRLARIGYDNMAYDFAVGMFVPEKKHVDRKVFEDDDIRDISDIIVGPLKSAAKQAKILKKGKSEYLDAQIAEINGKRALNLGYVYGDQAGFLFNKILSEYYGLGEKRTLNVYVFGRVGGLGDKMKHHDLVLPAGIVDEVDIKDCHHCIYPVHNALAGPGEKGLNLNVQSIVGETYELLEKAKGIGCACVEIEMRDAIEAINTARRRYSPLISINYGFVGYVSDLPLKGDTLADEHNLDKGEQAALGRIIDAIKEK